MPAPSLLLMLINPPAQPAPVSLDLLVTCVVLRGLEGPAFCRVSLSTAGPIPHSSEPPLLKGPPSPPALTSI